MTFNIGDAVIMTADSGKGETWVHMEDGEYRGKVISDSGFYPIMVELENGRRGSFNKDGSVPTHPGMSIRLAEETTCTFCHKSKGSSLCGDCIKSLNSIHRPTESHTTPSQWIEGQVPDKYEGIYYSLSHIKAVSLRHKNGNTKTTHILKGDWAGEEIAYMLCPLQLPPSPPAKEVEAYGYLEWDKMYDDEKNVNNHIDYSKVCRNDARRFYSQPATRDNLVKYLIKKDNWNGTNYESYGNLDTLISFYQKEYKIKLLFTLAALEELGVK